ncbi:MAG: SRPBCC domain-containing protein [Bacteroidia bacterium]
MSKEISTQIKINATTEQVWNVFSDFKNYPNWNPFIKSIQGDFEIGKVISIHLVLPDSKPMTFKPKVLSFEQNKKLIWLGHLMIKGIFDGEHKFELIDNKDGTCTFIQSEKFSGILVPLLRKTIEVKTVNGFNLMNKSLKERVESMRK